MAAGATGESPAANSGRVLVLFLTSRLSMMVMSSAAVTQGTAVAWLSGSASRYAAIASEGYSYPEYFAYLPAWVAMVKLFSLFVGDVATAALLAANFFFFVALYFVFMLGREIVGGEASLAATAVLAFLPTSYLFSSGTPDSLMVASIAAAYYFARRGNWPLSGCLGFVSSLTGLVGVLVLIPLITEYVVQKKGQWRDIAWLLVVPLGICAWLVYAMMHGAQPLNLITADPNRGVESLVAAFNRAFFGSWPQNLSAWLVAGSALFFSVWLVASMKTMPWALRVHLLLYGTAFIALPSWSVALSVSLLLFPALYALGQILETNRLTLAALLGTCGLLLGFLTLRHVGGLL